MPKVYKNYPHLPAPQGAYSQAVRVGDLLFIAGVTAAGPDVVQQARAIMATLKSILEAEGGTLGDIVKMTAYFTEMDRWRDADAVWAEAFGGHSPANTVIHVVALAQPAFKLEIEAVAYFGRDKEFKNYPHLAPPIGAYSYGVRAGQWVFLSGATARATPAQSSDLPAQADATLAKIASMMQAEGGSMRDLIKVTLWETELQNFTGLPDPRRPHFPQDPPASTLVQIVGLALPDLKIEIDAVGFLGPKQYKLYPQLGQPVGAFSQAVRVGDWLYLAGATARGTAGERGDIVAQTEAVYGKIATTLEAEGGSIRDVVKTVIYVTDAGEFPRTADLRRRLFGNNLPASTLIQVKALVVPHFKVEVEAIAYVGP